MHEKFSDKLQFFNATEFARVPSARKLGRILVLRENDGNIVDMNDVGEAVLRAYRGTLLRHRKI